MLGCPLVYYSVVKSIYLISVAVMQKLQVLYTVEFKEQGKKNFYMRLRNSEYVFVFLQNLGKTKQLIENNVSLKKTWKRTRVTGYVKSTKNKYNLW